MEGDAAASGEMFQDWELLQSSEPVDLVNSVENLRNLEEIDGDYTEGMIRSDYFSLDNDKRYAKTSGGVVDLSEEGSVESDNPSWIDPESETRYQRKNSGEFWPDSASDRSDERKFGEFDAKNEFLEGVGESKGQSDTLVKFSYSGVKNQLGFEEEVKSEMKSAGLGDIQGGSKESGRVWLDSGGGELSFGDHKEKQDDSVRCGECDGGDGSVMANSNVGAGEETESEVKSDIVGVEGGSGSGSGSGGEEAEKKRIVWWKVPIEVLRYCVWKVNPVWSFSVAAAVMGLVILGRRLYKMKRKPKSLQLRVTLDDKKVSQFTSRVARLNEAFSVVRRVPVIRPALPATGVNSWPVMGLR